MSLDTKIAESGLVVNAPSLDYSQKGFRCGFLQYQQQFPNTYGQPILLNTSQSQVTINLPPTVYNLAKSYLLYTVTLPVTTAAAYIWTPQDVISEISHIQYYGQNTGQMMCDLDNLQNYSKIMMKRNTSFEDYLTNDASNKLYPSNSLVNVAPAIRNGAATAGFIGPQPSNRNYVEPAYWNVGALSTAVSYQVLLPLKNISETIFSLDKNLYFGGQLTYLKLFFGPLSKICYQSSSNANPSAGAPIGYSTSDTTGPAITNLQLMLNVEVDPDISNEIMGRVNSSGISMIIPYPISYKNSNNGNTQNINIQFDVGNGRMLNKIIHSVFNVNESLDTMYDNANNPQGLGSLQLQKTLQYYTQLNSKRLQNITLDCQTAGLYTDYMFHRNQLRGSVLLDRNVYQWNWHHADVFDNYGPAYQQDNLTNNELISGIAMGDQKALTWQFNGQSMTSAQYQHYTYAIFSRKLTITATGVECV